MCSESVVLVRALLVPGVFLFCLRSIIEIECMIVITKSPLPFFIFMLSAHSSRQHMLSRNTTQSDVKI